MRCDTFLLKKYLLIKEIKTMLSLYFVTAFIQDLN
jgi:hypothetical protein